MAAQLRTHTPLLTYKPTYTCTRTQETLNAFLALGKPAWREARAALQRLLGSGEGALRDNGALRAEAVVPMVRVCVLCLFCCCCWLDV